MENNVKSLATKFAFLINFHKIYLRHALLLFALLSFALHTFFAERISIEFHFRLNARFKFIFQYLFFNQKVEKISLLTPTCARALSIFLSR